MAYTDRRRTTFAALAQQFPRLVWLRLNDQGIPEVTRRVTGLRQYRLVGSRTIDSIGSKVWTVRDVETGDEFHLPPMGNGTTVWTQHPKGTP